MVLASHDAALLVGGLAPQAINVDVDLTFLVPLVMIVALIFVLKPVLFDPMLRLFEERERRTEGAKAQARRVDEKSTTALAKYEAEMAAARMSANAERDKIRAQALAREQQILTGVRQVTAKVIEEGKRNARTEAERIRKSLNSQTTETARELATRVLGREVRP
jgi:F-type H+-transporting ATPase subunit b